jgi:hypothetical protein
MSKKSGQLLWNRMQITLTAGSQVVDTGLCQLNKAWANSSINEPGFGAPSRVQVIPMSPITAWSSVTHAEPVFNSSTQTVQVAFTNANEGPVTINVLFWDPATSVGPGEADSYVIA